MNIMSPPRQVRLAFPDSITFNKFFKPVRIEADVYDLEVDGEIPEALQGAYYRLGADARVSASSKRPPARELSRSSSIADQGVR